MTNADLYHEILQTMYRLQVFQLDTLWQEIQALKAEPKEKQKVIDQLLDTNLIYCESGKYYTTLK